MTFTTAGLEEVWPSSENTPVWHIDTTCRNGLSEMKVMLETSQPPITWEVRDGIGHIILDNPPANPMNDLWSAHAYDIVTNIKRADVKGVIVYSSGRHFSSGADLDSLQTSAMRVMNNDHDASNLLTNSDCFEILASLPVPVVAAVRGVCLGSGFELALACHYRICDTRATLGLVESTFGIMPGCGGTLRLPELVGLGRAVEYILTGHRLDSQEAYEMGVVQQVVAYRELVTTAIELINRLSPFYAASVH